MSVKSSSEVASSPCDEEEKDGRRAGMGRLSQSFSVETLLAPSEARPIAVVARAPVTRLLALGGGVTRLGEGQLAEDALDSVLHNQLLGSSRRTFADTQTYALEQTFQYRSYVGAAERRTLSLLTGLKDQQIKVWFQNRRAKHRREMTYNSRHFSSHGRPLQTSLHTQSRSTDTPGHSSWWVLMNGATPLTPYPTSMEYSMSTPPLSTGYVSAHPPSTGYASALPPSSRYNVSAPPPSTGYSASAPPISAGLQMLPVVFPSSYDSAADSTETTGCDVSPLRGTQQQ